MKKLLTFTLALVLVLNSFAQDKTTVASENNVLKVNSLAAIVGAGSIFWEHKLSDITSGQLGVCFMSYKLGDTRLSGFILTPELRIYPKKNAIDGFYIAPFLRYQHYAAKITDSDPVSKGTISGLGGGFLLGRQWIRPSGFTMDLFFGPQYSSLSAKATSGSDSFDTNLISGVGMRIGFALGFAF